MTYQEWAEKVGQKLGERRLNVRPKSWLYREAYYDAYTVEDAVNIALDPNQEFKMVHTGWMGPK